VRVRGMAVAAGILGVAMMGGGARGARAQSAAPTDSTATSTAAPGQSASAPVQAATNPELHARILKLMDITEVSANMDKLWTSMTPTLRPMIIQIFPPGANRDTITDQYLEGLGNSMRSPDALEGFVAIYAKYLTLTDVNAAIQFYSTPEGDHVRRATETMAPEMVKFGQDLAMKNAPIIMKGLCKKYAELKDSPNICGDAATPAKSELHAPAPVLAGK
jgi:hypothetical protein